MTDVSVNSFMFLSTEFAARSKFTEFAARSKSTEFAARSKQRYNRKASYPKTQQRDQNAVEPRSYNQGRRKKRRLFPLYHVANLYFPYISVPMIIFLASAQANIFITLIAA